MKVKVAHIAQLTSDTRLFELVSVTGDSLIAFTAGAHIDVRLADGRIRQYSLCNDPAENHRYQIAVLRTVESRGGSKAMHTLKEGDLLDISEPRNNFTLVDAAEHSILVAGGIGITPLLSMAQRLTRLGASFELHYCAREIERAAFLPRLQEKDLAPRVNLYFDDDETQRRLNVSHVLGAPLPQRHLYVCGPQGFMDYVFEQAVQRGWRAASLHREYFSAPVRTDRDDTSFDIKIFSTGQIIHVPAGLSVIQALSGAGIAIETSCEQGVCGTCLTRIISGIAEHRDVYLTEEEQLANDQFLPCCSRSRSPTLVLDL